MSRHPAATRGDGVGEETRKRDAELESATGRACTGKSCRWQRIRSVSAQLEGCGHLGVAGQAGCGKFRCVCRTSGCAPCPDEKFLLDGPHHGHVWDHTTTCSNDTVFVGRRAKIFAFLLFSFLHSKHGFKSTEPNSLTCFRSIHVREGLRNAPHQFCEPVDHYHKCTAMCRWLRSSHSHIAFV
jgi:hypothetical protein